MQLFLIQKSLIFLTLIVTTLTSELSGPFVTLHPSYYDPLEATLSYNYDNISDVAIDTNWSNIVPFWPHC